MNSPKKPILNRIKNSNVPEVGISDHRNLVLTALKKQFRKGSPKMKFYRDYKNFDLEIFNTELSTVLSGIPEKWSPGL